MTSHKDIMVKAAKAAGKIIREGYEKELKVELKEKDELLTKYDRLAEERIVSVLTERYPYRVVAEESGVTEGEGPYEWSIDPIDGTGNFGLKLPLLTVSIGLLKDGSPVEGVVYNPIEDELYYGDGETALLNGQPVDCSNKVGGKKYLFHDVHPRKADIATFLHDIAPIFSHITSTKRDIGCASYAICLVASGRGALFIGRGQETYDIVAAEVIARAAGCRVTDWKGDPWKPGASILIAAEPLHGKVMEILRE